MKTLNEKEIKQVSAAFGSDAANMGVYFASVAAVAVSAMVGALLYRHVYLPAQEDGISPLATSGYWFL